MTTKIVIAIIVVISLAVYVTFRQGDEYKKFLETAEKTHGVVLKKEERVADPKNQRKEKWVTYNFDTHRGMKTHTAQEFIEYDDIYQSIRSGDRIDVYYDPENPSRSHIAASIERRVGMAGKSKNQ
ncbi:MAG: DUF3592 domain-containing protein [Alphaproteobacteria bacterium]|nr:DUF3592 domain-containing protein [Alphaproteobacteria bacterium]